jgi:hypothetical protein
MLIAKARTHISFCSNKSTTSYKKTQEKAFNGGTCMPNMSVILQAGRSLSWQTNIVARHSVSVRFSVEPFFEPYYFQALGSISKGSPRHCQRSGTFINHGEIFKTLARTTTLQDAFEHACYICKNGSR